MKNENKMREKCLLTWYFESLLKMNYTNFIRALQVFSFCLSILIVNLLIQNNMLINKNKMNKVSLSRHISNNKIQSNNDIIWVDHLQSIRADENYNGNCDK